MSDPDRKIKLCYFTVIIHPEWWPPRLWPDVTYVGHLLLARVIRRHWSLVLADLWGKPLDSVQEFSSLEAGNPD